MSPRFPELVITCECGQRLHIRAMAPITTCECGYQWHYPKGSQPTEHRVYGDLGDLEADVRLSVKGVKPLV